MYVCLCNSVTETDVRALIGDGASTADEVIEQSGAGSGCGGCLGTLLEVLTIAGIRVDGRLWGTDQPGCSAAWTCPRAGSGADPLPTCASRSSSSN